MRVICIDDSGWRKGLPEFGKAYHVSYTEMKTHNGKPYYYHILIEYGDSVGFRVERFAIASSIDETELINQREQVTT